MKNKLIYHLLTFMACKGSDCLYIPFSGLTFFFTSATTMKTKASPTSIWLWPKAQTHLGTLGQAFQMP